MGIKEVLAAKKAAREAAEAAAKLTAKEETLAVAYLSEPELPKAEEISPLSAFEEPVKAPAPSAPSDRPMTFAEKLALKRGEITAAQAKPPAPAPVAVIDPAMIPENPEDAQAYVDIKNKIEALATLLGDDLRSAMSELKAALKKNSAATELMLDEDLGKMVVALRRMTNVVIADAKSPTKKAAGKTKAKDVALTADEIAAAFAEL
jgi:hypothetical protein